MKSNAVRIVVNLSRTALMTCFALWAISPLASGAPDYTKDIVPILQKHCYACHGADGVIENGLVMTSFTPLMKGGKTGPAVIPGNARKSLLYTMSAGLVEPKMPPDDAPSLSREELKLLEDWINAGAKGTDEANPQVVLKTPKIAIQGPLRSPIVSLALHPQGKWLAVASPEKVDIIDPSTSQSLHSIPSPTGVIVDVAVSKDGKRLVIASGETGLSGQVTLFSTGNWSMEQSLSGHRDLIYSCQLNNDGSQLLTGSYDRDVRWWDLKSSTSKAIQGHNDAVFGVALHPTRPLALSASGDRTVKVWDLKTAQRLDTFAQPAKEQLTVAIHPEGKHVAAGGVDMRLRVWELSPTASEGTNPLLVARFAHEAALIKLVYSPSGELLVTSSEDRRIKIWETRTYTQVAVFDQQPDWSTALAVSVDDSTLFVGRMDGSFVRIPLPEQLKKPKSATAPLEEIPVEPVLLTVEPMSASPLPEAEPNDEMLQAHKLLPGQLAKGLLAHAGDIDLYSLELPAGATVVLETKAARVKSLADTKLEVLNKHGQPVQRGWLQAVRDSWINFRPIDSSSPDVRVEFWEEMDLGQYLYMNGEVTRIARMPQGPDSGLLLATSAGKRKTWFDTTAIAHQKDDPVYIVEAWPLETRVVDNGLPVFPIFCANDDDSDRELGSDSRLTFTAPETGLYYVKVADSRGFGGKDFHYELVARPLKPDFHVKLSTPDRKVPRGSGQRISFTVDRVDHMKEPIEINVSGLPEGWHVTSPLVIDRDALETRGALWTDETAQEMSVEQKRSIQIVARSGNETRQISGFQQLELDKPARIAVRLRPDNEKFLSSDGGLQLPAGATITALIQVERNGYDGDIKFDVDGLPFGVIVDNIGLSGVLIRKGESERQIFLTSRPWVEPTRRFITAVSQNEGNQVSPAMVLEIVPAERGGLTSK